MSDYSSDSSVEGEVLREYGMTREEWMEAKEQDVADTERMGQHLRGSRAHKVDKEIKRRLAKKAEDQDRIEGCLRVLHQGKGKEFYSRVMVDTGATVNAITYGMLLDYELESRKTRLDEPHVLGLAVGEFECSEQVCLPWMGKGNEVHDTATFYVLPPGQANINDRVILSREWLNKRGLLFDSDPSPTLRPLFTKKPTASEEAAKKQERQRAMDAQAASAKAKDAYQKKPQTQQENVSTGPSQPKEDR